jgi:D-3-phosphoglycerate dehydrogenase
MTDTVDALVLDVLEWIGPGWEPYAEVIDARRTSCRRPPDWEEDSERGFMEHRRELYYVPQAASS